ncbi:MAG: GatB/YqeY domain-containing protein [Planctomycetota bacterium]
MSLQEQLEDHMKAAMRAKDTLRRDVLRMTVAELKRAKIDQQEDLTEADELKVIQKAVKSREEAATEYDKAGRADTAEKERAEAEVLRAYLPQMLSEDELVAAIEAKKAELGLESKKDMGQLIKAVMAEHGAKADGKRVSQLAAQALG